MLIHCLPSFGEPVFVALRAIKQRSFQFPFQLAYRGTDGRLRAEHTFCCPSDTALFYYRHEHFQLHQFHERTFSPLQVLLCSQPCVPLRAECSPTGTPVLRKERRPLLKYPHRRAQSYHVGRDFRRPRYFPEATTRLQISLPPPNCLPVPSLRKNCA